MIEACGLLFLSIEEIDQASELIARAFQEEPLFIYLFPDPTYRKEESLILTKNLIISGLISGEVFITSSKIEEMAVWNPFGDFEKKQRPQSRNLIKMLRHVRKELYLDHNLLEINGRFSEISTELH